MTKQRCWWKCWYNIWEDSHYHVVFTWNCCLQRSTLMRCFMSFSEYWQHRPTSLTCLDRTVTISECGCERRIPVERERRGAYNDSTCSRASYERGAGQKVIELEKNLREVWSGTITRRLLLRPSPGWKQLLPLSHLRHYNDTVLNRQWPHGK